MRVGILCYGLGNIGSLALGLSRVGCEVALLNDPLEARKYSHLVIPGVGHYATATGLLRERGWDDAVMGARDRGAAILGICLGMQLLAEGSAEAPSAIGLGVISGVVDHLSDLGCDLRSPHVGWNSVTAHQDSVLLGPDYEPQDFYFVHSYAFPDTNAAVVATADHGMPFGAVIERENVFGVQFHPEKSSVVGRTVLSNFIRFRPC
jgi:glutamine amidotransferase